MRLFDGVDDLRGRAPLGYALAVAAFIGAAVARKWLDGILPDGFPFLTFFPAVILTASAAGTGPAVLCAVLSGLAAWYWFLVPQGDFALDPARALALGFFVFIVTVDITLIHSMRRRGERLRAEQARTAELYAAQRVLFQELQHRVANNMAFVAALLHLQKRRVESDPAAVVSALDEAVRRIETMGRVHRRLYDPASAELPVDAHLRGLCDELLAASGDTRITARIDVQDVRLDITRLMTLSLLVTELVTNSLKHAFVARPSGVITLQLDMKDADRLELTVADNGCGLPPGFDPAAGPGLGSRIVESLAAQLGGELRTEGGPDGTRTRLTFAA